MHFNVRLRIPRKRGFNSSGIVVHVIIFLGYKMGLEGLHDSYFTSLYDAPYFGLLTNFAFCVFV